MSRDDFSFFVSAVILALTFLVLTYIGTAHGAESEAKTVYVRAKCTKVVTYPGTNLGDKCVEWIEMDHNGEPVARVRQ